jgi:hypothetical protein
LVLLTVPNSSHETCVKQVFVKDKHDEFTLLCIVFSADGFNID